MLVTAPLGKYTCPLHQTHTFRITSLCEILPLDYKNTLKSQEHLFTHIDYKSNSYYRIRNLGSHSLHIFNIKKAHQ